MNKQELQALLERYGIGVRRDCGGGGAAFTGVTAGTYNFGGGSITINGKGQVTNIVSGGGGGGTGATGATGCCWDPGFSVYVDKSYTGGDSDGTPCRPFTTIQEGIDLGYTMYSVLGFDTQSTVYVAGGGNPSQAYDEVALVFYPFVNVVGISTQDFVRVTSQAPIRLYSFGYYNIANLRFESEWNSVQTSLPFFNFFTWARFWNCRFDDAFTTIGIGADWHWYELHDCYFSGGGAVDVSNVTWWCEAVSSYSPLSAHATAAGTHTFIGKDGRLFSTGVYFYDGFQSGNVDTDESGPPPGGVWVETAGRIFGELEADGILSTVETTGDGYPEDGLSLLTSATKFPSGNALGLRYQPAGATGATADWGSIVPDTVGEALDLIAAAIAPVTP